MGTSKKASKRKDQLQQELAKQEPARRGGLVQLLVHEKNPGIRNGDSDSTELVEKGKEKNRCAYSGNPARVSGPKVPASKRFCNRMCPTISASKK